MIKSEIYKGLIYAGATQLACTIVIEQTAPMQLTVKAGVFTHTDGKQWTLSNDIVFNLVADTDYATRVEIEIGDIEGVVDVWCGTCVQDGVEEFNIPEGWNSGHPLVI